jgi:hypothetical protein
MSHYIVSEYENIPKNEPFRQSQITLQRKKSIKLKFGKYTDSL